MPFFSTDTVAAQRAMEVGCDVILMGKQGTDGVYDSDPQMNPDARMFTELSYDEFLTRNLKVADATAISMARDFGMPMIFFNLDVAGNIARAVAGETLGTRVYR
jgi:uridylate kinase